MIGIIRIIRRSIIRWSPGVLLPTLFHIRLLGKVNHFPAFLVHFPAEKVDSTTISPFFPGKVNHFAANQVHFPPMVHTLQGTTGVLHRGATGKPQGK